METWFSIPKVELAARNWLGRAQRGSENSDWRSKLARPARAVEGTRIRIQLAL